MRVAIYARISRDDLGSGLGVDRQREDCERLCSTRGWAIVRQYVDNDVSAFSGRSRPGYDQLLSDVAGGVVDAVVAWAPERLHRSPRQLEDFIELVDARHVTVETVKAGAWDVSTSHGRLVARMLGAVSRAESERTGERVSRAHQQAKEAGRWRGPVPYGMRASAAAGLPEPDPEQAAVVVEIFQRVTRGDALTRIAGDLTRRGVRPRRGVKWTHTGVLRLVASPALGGLIMVNDHLQQAAFGGVVSPEDWKAAQSALRARPRGETRRPREKLTLLGGLLTCAEHGHVLFGGSASHAATYVAGSPGQCYVSITRRAADELVEGLVLARFKRSDAADLFRAREPADHVQSPAAPLRQRRDDLLQLIADGVVSASAARPQLIQISDALVSAELTETRPLVSAAQLEAPERTWEEWTTPQRRMVLRQLFETLTLAHVGPRQGPRADPTRLHVTWSNGDRQGAT